MVGAVAIIRFGAAENGREHDESTVKSSTGSLELLSFWPGSRMFAVPTSLCRALGYGFEAGEAVADAGARGESLACLLWAVDPTS